MEEATQEQQFFLELNTRIRELEERQHLIKDRMMLLSKGVIDLKDKITADMRELRKNTIQLQQENDQLKETLGLMSEKLNNTVRQEEIAIIKRQLDLIREDK